MSPDLDGYQGNKSLLVPRYVQFHDMFHDMFVY
jgi:hypothetical protein